MTLVNMSGSILSTPNQVAQEVHASRIFATAPVQSAIDQMVEIASGSPLARLPAAGATMRDAMAELAFAYVIRNLNADPARPKLLWDQNPPRVIAGAAIPGSRCTGNNPDNIYRRIPLDAGHRYVLRGRVRGPLAPDISFSVLPSVAQQENWTQTMLGMADIVRDADGFFEILLNARPTKAQRNHIHLAPGAIRLTIRESMTDWATDTPLALEVMRVNRAARTERLDDAATAERFAAKLPDFARHWIDFDQRTYYGVPVNDLPMPKMPPGGLTTQITAMGNYDLHDDEALVITADPRGAAYFAFTAMDPWMRAAHYRTHTQSLTSHQAVPNPDGSYTVVLALQDPGVSNWLDPAGLTQGAVQCRWQGLPAGVGECGGAMIRTTRIPLADLAEHLPESTRWLTCEERTRQQAMRAASHDRRLTV